MSQNSEIKNKVISSVISIITAIALIIINISSIEVREKIIYSIIFIGYCCKVRKNITHICLLIIK
ncbi:hypothetical protein SSCS72_02904 [Mammaliicoccus sciuri]|nr:hypothetical protein SSCS72_02904 [Mammaliicoccus sciuri]